MAVPVCAPVPAQQVRAAWFNGDAPTNTSVTLERMFDACSYRKLLWRSANNHVAAMDMPCAGSRPDDVRPGLNVSFDFGTQCRNPQEFDTWRYFATKYAREKVRRGAARDCAGMCAPAGLPCMHASMHAAAGACSPGYFRPPPPRPLRGACT